MNDSRSPKRKRRCVQSGFWTGGFEAYEEGLRKEMEARIGDLKERLQTVEDEAERAALVKQIEQIKREFKEKLRGSDNLLF